MKRFNSAKISKLDQELDDMIHLQNVDWKSITDTNIKI